MNLPTNPNAGWVILWLAFACIVLLGFGFALLLRVIFRINEQVKYLKSIDARLSQLAK